MRQLARKIIVHILKWEATRALKKWKPTIILVSGSVGKTTTKDAIYHALKNRGTIRKSQKSFNSEIGVPLTILGLDNSWSNPFAWIGNLWRGFRLTSVEKNFPITLVLEVGSDHPGDIAQILSWIQPDLVVVTSLPEVPVHVENFLSPEDIRREDGLVVGALKTNGVYVANLDDAKSCSLIEDATQRNLRIVTYGFAKNATVKGSHVSVRYAMNEGVRAPVGMESSVTIENKEYPVYMNDVLGTGICSAILAAIAVGVALDEGAPRLTNDMVYFSSPPGRMRIMSGKGGTTIIDDTYNSSPIALASALVTLQTLESTRKIAILGDMLELGSFTNEEHWKAGRIAGAFVDELVTVGTQARLIAEAAKSAGLPEGRIHHFALAEDAGRFVESIMKRGDVILAKGSQGSGENMIRIERAVKLLMAHPDLAENTLVRQEPEWLAQYK